MISNEEVKTRIDFAHQWIKSVRAPILELYFNQDIKTDWKTNATEVTEADRTTERSFRNQIAQFFPNDGIIGEEFPNENKQSDGFWWSIDPIDGTRAFVHGVPFFGTMIGLCHNEKILYGLIAFHALDEILYAGAGTGCFWQRATETPQKVQVTDKVDMKESILCITGEEYFNKSNKLDFLKRLQENFKFHRTWGDCYGYCLLVRGKIDVMIDPALQPWDVIPLKVIVEEAGGALLDINGKNSNIHSRSAIACGLGLIKSIINVL